MSRDDSKLGSAAVPRLSGAFSASPGTDGAEERPTQRQRKSGRKRKVMIVDDDPTVLRGTAALLEAAGYEVVARAEALGTMVAISRESPDIVVIDVEMPGLSGDAISSLLSRRKERLCVLFHSSRPRTELARMVRETSARGAIPKGDLREFLKTFEALLPADLRARS